MLLMIVSKIVQANGVVLLLLMNAGLWWFRNTEGACDCDGNITDCAG